MEGMEAGKLSQVLICEERRCVCVTGQLTGRGIIYVNEVD